MPVASYVDKFRDEFRAHVDDGGCPFAASRRSTHVLAPVDQHAHTHGHAVPRLSDSSRSYRRRPRDPGPEGDRPRRDAARGGGRDPGLLLRAAPRPAGRRVPDVPRRDRGQPEAPGRLHADRAGRAGRADGADLGEGRRGPERDARVHPRQPPARLPGLRQGRRVPAAGPDVPLRARPHAHDVPKRTFDKPIPISPHIALDRERCILCYRCTRFSESVAEDGELVAREPRRAARRSPRSRTSPTAAASPAT